MTKENIAFLLAAATTMATADSTEGPLPAAIGGFFLLVGCVACGFSLIACSENLCNFFSQIFLFCYDNICGCDPCMISSERVNSPKVEAKVGGMENRMTTAGVDGTKNETEETKPPFFLRVYNGLVETPENLHYSSKGNRWKDYQPERHTKANDTDLELGF